MTRALWLIFSLLLALAACDDTSSSTEIPDAVTVAVSIVVDALESGEIERIEPFLSPEFETSIDDPLAVLVERSDVRERLLTVLASNPGLRRSPFGNGAVQELWIYPRMALEPPDTWTEAEVQAALDSGLMTDEELSVSREVGAYRAFSAGFDLEGNWLFFVNERVSPTPHP